MGVRLAGQNEWSYPSLRRWLTPGARTSRIRRLLMDGSAVLLKRRAPVVFSPLASALDELRRGGQVAAGVWDLPRRSPAALNGLRLPVGSRGAGRSGPAGATAPTEPLDGAA